jgi:cell division protein FtsA
MFRENEVVDLIPTAYVVDRGSWVDNPVGRVAKELKVIYQVYTVDCQYMSMLSELFRGFDQVCYYPSVRAYQETLPEMHEVALVDLGASGIQVAVFHKGVLWHEAYLPLGCRTIDKDIMCAYGVNSMQARQLKHEHGEALRMLCKNKKVQIPETNLTLESRDLATVVQCRAEELLEGIVYLLQTWKFDYQNGKILLAGGGSRLKNLDVLLQRLSGCSVERAVPCGIETSRGDLLRTPEYLIALGLLKCQTVDEEVKDSLIDRVMDKLKGIFN